jgi:elongation factor Ts
MSTATAIDAQQVKTLRERTGAGLMECKRALAETNGDIEAAVDLLRKKSTKIADTKGSRETKEGMIAQAILPGAKIGALVEINCETDFVAKNDGFKAFADGVVKKIASQADAADIESERVAAVHKLGENLVVRRSERVEVTGHGSLAAYIHTGGKVGVLVEVGSEKEDTASKEEFKQLVRDITLQIAAAHPICVDRTQVPAALAERERAIYRDQVPPDKADRAEQVIEGKMVKLFYSRACLVDQAFIKDPHLTIAQLVAAKSKELGDNLVIRRFLRYMVGEEIAAS